MKQQNLFSQTLAGKREYRQVRRRCHGGQAALGKRKEARPFHKNRWVHLVLKSEKARGSMSFLAGRNRLVVRDILKAKARKFGVVVSDYANVGNHLHLSVRAQSREAFANFLRAVTALIARHVTGARRGKPFRSGDSKSKFWSGLAYTRVLMSQFEQLQLRGYIEANRIEAAQSKTVRVSWLASWNRYLNRNLKRVTLNHGT